MRKIFKGINILLSVLLIFIAVAVAFIAFPQFGNKALIVRSGSMAPTIDIGSIVVARPVENATYKKGDVIAFRSEKNSKTIITHRIVEVESGPDGVFYITKGDANEEKDQWSVERKNVLGKVAFVIPFAGKVLTFAKSDLGFPTLIIFPAVLVILIESFSIFKEIKKRRKSLSDDNPFGFMIIESLNKKGHATFKILIPLVALTIAVPATLAVMKDTEESKNNIFQAASQFPVSTPSAALSPTSTPTPTVTPSITPEPTP